MFDYRYYPSEEGYADASQLDQLDRLTGMKWNGGRIVAHSYLEQGFDNTAQ